MRQLVSGAITAMLRMPARPTGIMARPGLAVASSSALGPGSEAAMAIEATAIAPDITAATVVATAAGTDVAAMAADTVAAQ